MAPTRTTTEENSQKTIRAQISAQKVGSFSD